MGLNSAKDFSEKNLLVITPSYPNKDNTFIVDSFVKSQLEPFKKYFKNIYVVAPVLFTFKKLTKDRLCEDYSYDNIKVYYPRCYYIPIFLCKTLIDNRFKVIDSLIKEENIKFDLVHAHFTWPSSYIGIRLKEKYHRPVIVTIHENSEWLSKEITMNHPLINNSWKNADALLRVNKIDIQVLKKYNDNVFSISNGFSPRFKPLDRDECRKKLGLPLDHKIIFSLGWLIERKGFNYLIDSMKIITTERDDVLCFIGGAAPSEDELRNKVPIQLQKQITDLNLQDYVKLIGAVQDDLLPLWMNACDIFVLPSLGEGNPVVMFESLGCGKPFVGTRVGGIPEVIISEDYGLIADPKNSKDLAEKIKIALKKEWNSSNIREYAEQFTWDKIAIETCKIYSEISGRY